MRGGNAHSLDTGRGKELAIFLLWFLKDARLTAQLTATTRSLVIDFRAGAVETGQTMR
jgi:hypothetical protein